MNDRKNSIDDIIKAAKVTPGIGKYNLYDFDEKRVKPAKGKMSKDEKFTIYDEMLFLGKGKPKMYEPIELVSYPI